MGRTTYLLVVALLWASGCLAESDFCVDTTLQEVKKLLDQYDFIVVGAGAAGSVVANRLSEIKNITVLLLEAGGDEDPIQNDIPYMRNTLRLTEQDWQFQVEKQTSPYLATKPQNPMWTQGKVLGGSTAINGMAYIRGNRRDFELWNKLAGGGWSWKEVLHYFKKSQDSKVASGDAGYHGFGGPLTVSNNEFTNDSTNIFLDAAKEMGMVQGDLNGQFQTGIMPAQYTIRRGARCSTNKAFLKSAAHRDNLHVVKYARVIKVLFEEKKNGKPRATGVVFLRLGLKTTVNGSREIILSAGAVNSPRLLLLSGVGPKKHLDSVNITVIADRPGVGENLQDQPMANNLVFTEDVTIAYPEECAPVTDFPSELTQWSSNRTGRLTAPGLRVEVFIKTRFANKLDDYPDIQMEVFQPLKTIETKIGFIQNSSQIIIRRNTIVSLVYLLKTKSSGYVRLRDSDPMTPPIINPNLYQHKDDVKKMNDGVKKLLAFGQTSVFKERGITARLVSYPGCEKYDESSEEFFNCSMSNGIASALHIVGSCKLGASNDTLAVVDGRLRVIGVQGLRVADASIMPECPNGNTMTPTIMIGERVSDFIKSDYNLIRSGKDLNEDSDAE